MSTSENKVKKNGAAAVERTNVNEIEKLVIKNKDGMEVTCISLGATVTSIKLPDGTDVVLGYADLEDYRVNECYLGCSVGRVANRIRDATFTVEGQECHVSANIPPHTLHGGVVGFNKANWAVHSVGDNSVTFCLTSPDGDMSYPGEVVAKATYTLTEEGEVMVQYEATTDKPTIVNLVNHAYFNLAQMDTIHKHQLKICATEYTPLDGELIATGELEDFSQCTYLDFTQATAVGLHMPKDGYDHNYNVGGSKEFHPQHAKLHLCAVLSEGPRELKVYSDQPGMQLYTGKYLDASANANKEKAGCPSIQPYAGLCLETQAWPNAVNHSEESVRSQVVLKPGETYKSNTLWEFKWDKEQS